MGGSFPCYSHPHSVQPPLQRTATLTIHVQPLNCTPHLTPLLPLSLPPPNNQETNRHGVSANVDERTRFEMYYTPFIGAVEADVGSVVSVRPLLTSAAAGTADDAAATAAAACTISYFFPVAFQLEKSFHYLHSPDNRAIFHDSLPLSQTGPPTFSMPFLLNRVAPPTVPASPNPNLTVTIALALALALVLTLTLTLNPNPLLPVGSRAAAVALTCTPWMCAADQMCSYNLINGRWSCENNETLAVDFKQRIGFQGWVRNANCFVPRQNSLQSNLPLSLAPSPSTQRAALSTIPACIASMLCFSPLVMQSCIPAIPHVGRLMSRLGTRCCCHYNHRDTAAAKLVI